MTKPGDIVLIKTKDKELKGIFMPNEETDSVVIKLDNGYNVGINKKHIKEMKLVKSYKEKKFKKEKIN